MSTNREISGLLIDIFNVCIFFLFPKLLVISYLTKLGLETQSYHEHVHNIQYLFKQFDLYFLHIF